MLFTVISLALFITSLDAAGLKTAPIASVLDLLTGAAMNVNPFASDNDPMDHFLLCTVAHPRCIPRCIPGTGGALGYAAFNSRDASI